MAELDENFEKGKQLIIDGLEAFNKQYSPYLKIIDGANMLGISDYFEVTGKDSSLIRIALDTMIGDLKRASNQEEILKAMEDSEYLWDVFNIDRKHDEHS
jgi:hypothetical protein